MNRGRILLGGLLGGVVFNVVSILVNVVVLGNRYKILTDAGVFRTEPRGAFMAVHPLLLFVSAIGLTWLYAAARPRLGAGPKTALQVGLLAGLVTSLPSNFAQYAWTRTGGTVAMWWTIEMAAGCALATLAGAWVYREETSAASAAPES